jgi:hypothetical protein
MKNTTYITIITILLIPVTAINAEGLNMGVRADLRGRGGDMDMGMGLHASGTPVNPPGRMMEMRNATSGEMRMKARADMKVGLQADMAKRKAALEARRIELKAGIEDKKLENKAMKAKKLEVNKAAKVQEKLAAIYQRLTDKVNGLTRVDAELTTRIGKISAAGVDVSATQALLVTAQASLAKAKVDVEATQSIAISETMSTTTAETLRGLVATAEVSVKAAAANYMKVVEAVKALPKPAVRVNATSAAAIN